MAMPGVDLEQRGVEAYQQRDYQRALRALRQAVAVEHVRPSAWLWLSRTQLALDDANSALNSIVTYLQFDPVSPRGILQLVAVLRKQGEREQAIKLLTTLAQNHLDEEAVLRQIVTRLLGFDAFTDAAELAQRLLSLQPDDLTAVVALATALGHSGTFAEAEALIDEALGSRHGHAALAKSQAAFHLGMAAAAWEAASSHTEEPVHPSHVIGIAQLLLQQGHGSLALEAAEQAERAAVGDREIGQKVERIRGEVRILEGAWSAPAWKARPSQPNPGAILHVVGASAPHRQTGYTVRTHSIVQSQREAGLFPEVVTPLGFPWTDGVNEAPMHEEVGGIPHYRLAPFDAAASLRFHRRDVMKAMPVRPDDRLTENARRLAILAGQLRPAVLHAASDFRNALLALHTGQVLRIPVVYEVRGFWQETWLSRSAFHSSDAEVYRWRTRRELECALQADHVVTLAEVMKRELVESGVPAEKILVVPNAVDVAAFEPLPRDLDLAARLGIQPGETVLGYISSMVPYEGIRYLIAATARLIADGEPVRTLLVGDGTERERLQAYAADLGIADCVIFTGRVPHAEVPAYYSLIDIFVVPRTDDRVSRLVTPLKPYEAMAMERTVMVSAVPALEEMVVAGETGLTFRAEDAEHLAAVASALIASPERRAVLGRNARAWVCQHRTWSENGRRYRELYDALGAKTACDAVEIDEEAVIA